MKKNGMFDKLKMYEIANQSKTIGGTLEVTTDECTTKGTTDSGDCGDQGSLANLDSVATTTSMDQSC